MTNQALTKGGKASNVVVPYPSDPTGAFHDVRPPPSRSSHPSSFLTELEWMQYTIEWTKSATIFSFDGKEVGRLTTNVPPSPMAFIWNKLRPLFLSLLTKLMSWLRGRAAGLRANRIGARVRRLRIRIC